MMYYDFVIIYSDISGFTMIYCDLIIVYSDLLWFIMKSYEILWITMIHFILLSFALI